VVLFSLKQHDRHEGERVSACATAQTEQKQRAARLCTRRFVDELLLPHLNQINLKVGQGCDADISAMLLSGV
jgi:hypothetical protein